MRLVREGFCGTRVESVSPGQHDPNNTRVDSVSQNKLIYTSWKNIPKIIYTDLPIILTSWKNIPKIIYTDLPIYLYIVEEHSHIPKIIYTDLPIFLLHIVEEHHGRSSRNTILYEFAA